MSLPSTNSTNLQITQIKRSEMQTWTIFASRRRRRRSLLVYFVVRPGPQILFLIRSALDGNFTCVALTNVRNLAFFALLKTTVVLEEP